MVSDAGEAWFPRRSSAARYCYSPLFVARPSCCCLRQTQPFLLFFKLYIFLYGPFLFQKAVMDRRYPALVAFLFPPGSNDYACNLFPSGSDRIGAASPAGIKA